MRALVAENNNRSAVALKPRAHNSNTITDYTNEETSRLPSKSAVDDSIKAVFRMVAPPERKQEGSSAKAIEHYEKRRTITMARVSCSLLGQN